MIAAHDIGALGYYRDCDILDLAGLVLSDVFSFIRDERRLAAYLEEGEADYLVMLEGWYPYPERLGEVVYRTVAPFSPSQGGTKKVDYKLED